ncbi:hypothetical protein WN55_00693 [Dufourea novaeangliae]|uniref:C2H2-type domain-containing protein n=1 Tax=Dufourea novaeangliae TaxID=178035 RepID=A0A154P041_DUFNO|nr:hypothetical protein WN55_00693 [Dufourea novaeangliae]
MNALKASCAIRERTRDRESKRETSFAPSSGKLPGGEAFAPLLNYMYTGRLEVTLDNVYSVLLATHLLHMPGALEQCRAALLRLRAPPPPLPVPIGPTSTLTSTSMPPVSTTGNILRPIPNRLMIDPGMCWPTTTLYPSTGPTTNASIGIHHLPRLQPSVLMQSTVPLNVSVIPTPVGQETSTRYSEASSPKPPPFHMERNHGSREIGHRSPERMSSSFIAAAAFTAFANSSTARALSPCRSISPAPSSDGSQSSIPSNRSKKSSKSPAEQRQTKEEREYERATSLQNGQTQNRGSPVTSADEIGLARGRSNETTTSRDTDRPRSSKRRRGSSAGNDTSIGVLSVVYDVACCDGPVKFHRVLNENYSSTSAASCGSGSQTRLPRCYEAENASSENDENGGPVGKVCETLEPEPATAAAGSYTCGYCRHTFKSQYCYRKHTKRHLLPTRGNEPAGNRQKQEHSKNRREVRLLDLNVQYYPCKICGCKFPSYYFVHKHRKLCHAEETPQQPEEIGATEEDRKMKRIDPFWRIDTRYRCKQTRLGEKVMLGKVPSISEINLLSDRRHYATFSTRKPSLQCTRVHLWMLGFLEVAFVELLSD